MCRPHVVGYGLGFNRDDAGDAHDLDLSNTRAFTQSSETAGADDVERWFRSPATAPSFTTRFRPIFDSTAKRVVGLEALLHWQVDHSTPAHRQLVATAENSDLIIPIGAHVIDEACRQVAWWRSNLPGARHLYAAVNVSTPQLLSRDIVHTVGEALHRHGLGGDALWLNVGDTVLAPESRVTTAAALTSLRLLDIRLALKHAPPSFASSPLLGTLHLSRLTLDPQLVARIDDDDDTARAVHHLITASAEVGLDVLADGVDSRNRAIRLRELGCTTFQATHYSTGVRSDDVPALLVRLDRHNPALRRHLRVRHSRRTRAR